MSSSGVSNSNVQQASVKLANETGGNAPAAVARAGAIMEQNRSIRTPKPYYPKKDNNFKTWSNMKIQPKEDESESKNGGQVLTAETNTFQTGILAVQGCIEGKEIHYLILDTESAVSYVSSQFYETIINKVQLQPIKCQSIAVNKSLLNIKGSVELTIAIDKIEITHKFLCVDTKLSLALLGYDFLQTQKVDILTSANCLLLQNVPIITHMHKRRNKVRENMGRHISANEIYEKSY